MFTPRNPELFQSSPRGPGRVNPSLATAHLRPWTLTLAKTALWPRRASAAIHSLGSVTALSRGQAGGLNEDMTGPHFQVFKHVTNHLGHHVAFDLLPWVRPFQRLPQDLPWLVAKEVMPTIKLVCSEPGELTT